MEFSAHEVNNETTEFVEVLDTKSLSKGARKIFDAFTEDQRKALALAKGCYAGTAIPEKPLPHPQDFYLAEIVAKVSASDGGEMAMGQLFESMHLVWPHLTRRTFNNLRAAVEFARASALRKAQMGTKTNIVDVHTPRELASYAIGELKRANEVTPTVFRRGAELVEVLEVKEEDRVKIVDLDAKRLKARLFYVAPFRQSVGENGFKEVTMPNDVADAIFHFPTLPVPYLKGKVEAPYFKPGGDVVQQTGYDKDTMLYYRAPESLKFLSVPYRVSEEDLANARALLVDLFADFEMDGASRQDLEAAALHGRGEVPASFLAVVGWLIEQSVRPVIGDAPLMPMLVSKTAPGAGGSLLAKAMQTIVEGRSSSRPLSTSEEEVRKAILSMLMSSPMTAFFDNLPQGRELDSDALSSLFTEPVYSDRVLGQTSERSLPVRMSTIMVGNRPMLSQQLQRRVTLCELIPQTPDPAKRTGFKHPNLLQHVRENRADYLQAVLVLVRNWFNKGCPKAAHAPAVGSYEAYTAVVPAILEAASPYWTTWHGNRARLEQIASDVTQDATSELVEVWFSQIGTKEASADQLCDLVKNAEIALDIARKRGAESDYDFSVRAMGKLLAGHQDTVLLLECGQQVKIVKGAKGRDGVKWHLQTVAESAPEPVESKVADNVASLATARQEREQKEVADRVKEARPPKRRRRRDPLLDRAGPAPDSPFKNV